MHVGKFLSISTAHITYEDSLVLARLTGDSGFAVSDNDYGWHICVHEDRAELEENQKRYAVAGMSDAFLNILEFANDLECELIALDQDGAIYPYIEQFDW